MLPVPISVRPPFSGIGQRIVGCIDRWLSLRLPALKTRVAGDRAVGSKGLGVAVRTVMPRAAWVAWA